MTRLPAGDAELSCREGNSGSQLGDLAQRPDVIGNAHCHVRPGEVVCCSTKSSACSFRSSAAASPTRPSAIALGDDPKLMHEPRRGIRGAQWVSALLGITPPGAGVAGVFLGQPRCRRTSKLDPRSSRSSLRFLSVNGTTRDSMALQVAPPLRRLVTQAVALVARAWRMRRPTDVRQAVLIDLRLWASHPSETGRRQRRTGGPIPVASEGCADREVPTLSRATRPRSSRSARRSPSYR